MSITAAASSGVIFSKIHRKSAQVIGRKCFCTPGEKPSQIRSIDHEEIPFWRLKNGATLFGETLKMFVDGWNTERYSDLERNREIALWGSFFACPKNFWKATKMAILREADDSEFFEAQIIGDPSWIATLSQNSFDLDLDDATTQKEIAELQAHGLGTKQKVSVFAKNRFFSPLIMSTLPSPQLTCDMREPFSKSLKQNKDAFHAYGIHPLAVKQFALSSVHKMIQTVDANFPTIQHFSEEDPVLGWNRVSKAILKPKVIL